MAAAETIREAIESFDAVTWCSCGEPQVDEDDPDYMSPGWVKFAVEKSELGWRVLEFLAWVTTDMARAGERLHFFPTSAPPYLNTPGDCLSFVLEVYPEVDDAEERLAKVAEFIKSCTEEYWPACRPS